MPKLNSDKTKMVCLINLPSLHNYSTKHNGLDMVVPKVSTVTAKKGCYFFGAQIFNNLPSSMKETKSLFIFKTLIKDFYIENS